MHLVKGESSNQFFALTFYPYAHVHLGYTLNNLDYCFESKQQSVNNLW